MVPDLPECVFHLWCQFEYLKCVYIFLSPCPNMLYVTKKKILDLYKRSLEAWMTHVDYSILISLNVSCSLIFLNLFLFVDLVK